MQMAQLSPVVWRSSEGIEVSSSSSSIWERVLFRCFEEDEVGDSWSSSKVTSAGDFSEISGSDPNDGGRGSGDEDSGGIAGTESRGSC